MSKRLISIIALAIELDDSSHYRPNKIARDDFLNEAFKSAGLPLLRIKNASHYDQATITKTIDKRTSKW